MKQFPVAFIGAIGGILGSLLGANSIAAVQTAPSAAAATVPILFNNHHVGAKPTRVKRERVLAAIVRNGEMLVPLRSMLARLGAAVNYEPHKKNVDVHKPGADIWLTVGKRSIVLNGNLRPLDVPPEIDDGVLLAPVRVISEAMGAYVQWIPSRHVVVIRHNPAPTPTPVMQHTGPVPSFSSSPTSAPEEVQPLRPGPVPTPVISPFYDRFVKADFALPTVYNELSPGNAGNSSYQVNGAAEFRVKGVSFMIGGDFRALRYPHNAAEPYGGCVLTTPGGGCNTVVTGDPIYQSGLCPSADEGCVTAVGYPLTQAYTGLGQVYVPGRELRESDFDGHLGWRVAQPRVYLAVGGMFKHYQYLEYPNLAGFGFGLEKLPDLDKPVSLYGSLWYYPQISGGYTFPTAVLLGPLSAKRITVSYSWMTYGFGGTYNLGKTGAFLDVGFLGERARAKQNAPASATVTAPFVGLGVHL